MYKVFKFGGASVKDANAVKNVSYILKKYKTENIVIVISAMGKTTNALEEVVDAYCYDKAILTDKINNIITYHETIINELFHERNHQLNTEFKNIIEKLNLFSIEFNGNNYDYIYDQIVPYGEIIATTIVHHYLKHTGINNMLFYATDIIKTNNHYREAKIEWDETLINIENKLIPAIHNNKNNNQLAIIQGFIGGTKDNLMTTLGREGSDYTASIIAYCIHAEEVVIWKDVPGVLNADPKYFTDTIKLQEITYQEAIELSYYGATIIHPKTIQPLQNRNIPMKVKSFVAPEEQGTIITNNINNFIPVPCYIFKQNQILISIMPKDFSFIAEDNLSFIFSLFAKHNVKVNLMQISAISFSVCSDYIENRIEPLITDLKCNFSIKYNTNLQLYTIRHYNDNAIRKITMGKAVLLEQKSRSTIQFITKSD